MPAAALLGGGAADAAALRRRGGDGAARLRSLFSSFGLFAGAAAHMPGHSLGPAGTLLFPTRSKGEWQTVCAVSAFGAALLRACLATAWGSRCCCAFNQTSGTPAAPAFEDSTCQEFESRPQRLQCSCTAAAGTVYVRTAVAFIRHCSGIDQAPTLCLHLNLVVV